MARTVVITDDITGEQGAEEVEFSWGGVNYTIDLAEDNRKKFEDAIRPYLDKAQPRMAPSDAARMEAARPRQRRRGGEGRIDYSSPENAGMPHRGRVTPAEAEYVRAHLNEVNKRREAAGKPPIDPQSADDKKRYGLK